MKGGTSGRVNKKVLAVGAVTVVALAAMAMVYYSAYDTATVTAKQVLSVSIPNLQDVPLKAPGIWVDKTLGTVNVTVDNSSGSFDNLTYRLILDIPSLSAGKHSDLSNVRSLAIAVYNGSTLEGFLTPWTPTLTIDKTVDPSTNTSVNHTYELKLNGIAFKATSSQGITLGVKASVEILSIS